MTAKTYACIVLTAVLVAAVTSAWWALAVWGGPVIENGVTTTNGHMMPVVALAILGVIGSLVFLILAAGNID